MLPDRSQIIAENPLDAVMELYGATLRGSGNQRTTNRCGLVEHKPIHQCVSVDIDKQVWHCHDCKQGGSVIDFVAFADEISAKEAMAKLGGAESLPPLVREVRQKREAAAPNSPPEKAKLVKTYDYADANGKLLYQVCRMEPKDFRQRQPKPDGGWEWTMKGANRVLYNLRAVKAASFVWIVEGEKDADTLIAMSLCATCNVGGAEKWEDSYSRTLKGKEIIICGDNDDAGRKHVEKVHKAIAMHVRSVAVMEIPPEYKDVTEYAESFSDRMDAANAIVTIASQAEVFHGGMKVPVRSMAEIEVSYREYVKIVESVSFSLGGLFPKLVVEAGIRPLVPGELMTLLMGTGWEKLSACKTSFGLLG